MEGEGRTVGEEETDVFCVKSEHRVRQREDESGRLANRQRPRKRHRRRRRGFTVPTFPCCCGVETCRYTLGD